MVRTRSFTSVSPAALALGMALVAGAALAPVQALAQTADATGTQATTDDGTETAEDAPANTVVVTGYRASLANALNIKRESNQIVDAITAEDIADFPDANLAESIQRLPGVSIDRDNGEGRSITIRGLGGDFQMTRLNGADAQNVAGGNSSDSGANRTRGFDFNTFASELFGGVKVTKSTAAVNDEGSLGAIIDLTTGRPLSYKKNRFALGVEGEYRENGKTWNPRLTGLASFRITDNFGILGSFAYQHQQQQIDRYQRSIGAFEYTYRNSQLNGVTPNTFGFARPSTAGTGATFGSDPAAYALITPTTIIPALASVGRQKLDYERLGATLTAQWRPTDRTEIVIDGVYSRYDQDSENYLITPVGLNRNGTNARVAQNTLRAVNTTNGNADRVALYPTCTQSAVVDCGAALYGGGIVTGMLNSLNPNNLNPYDYYNNPLSRGYIASANRTAYYNELIGRPNTKIMAAHVNDANQADYLVLDDVDWRSQADSQYGSTIFKQATINIHQDFSDTFFADATAGISRSEFRAVGLLTEFNAIDKDGFVFDDRNGGEMPVFNPGFNVADPNSWTLVKGLSTIRYFTNKVDNEFKVGRLNFGWEIVPEFTLRFGGTYKKFDYSGDQGRRSQTMEAINPTLLEAGLNITDLGQMVGFGQGLKVSAGTPTQFYAPSLTKFQQQFQIACNCINKWGDFRAAPDGRQGAGVQEEDLSGFLQGDWDTMLFGIPFRGDIGIRIARTKVVGTGNVGGADGVVGIPVSANNEYTDYLPSANLVFEPMPDFLFRVAAAKVISRPQLASLTPGTTSFASGLNASGAAPAITVGNPYLNPFRATNVDVSFEKYFGKNGLIGVTLFYKDIASFPQQIAAEAPLSSVFEDSIYQQLVTSMTSPTLQAYTQAGGVWAIRQFADAPGGTIKGVEVNFQTDFFFLPAPFDDFGVTANYTHVESKLNYLTGTVLSTTQTQTTGTAANSFAEAPFLNTSPDAFNATLYYENKLWTARVSGAYRARYVNRFPLASGTCSVGTTTNAGGACNSPVVADFGYNENTFNLDAAFTIKLNKAIKLSLEGRNLTNETSYRTMYGANPVTQTYASTGRIITGGVRMIF